MITAHGKITSSDRRILIISSDACAAQCDCDTASVNEFSHESFPHILHFRHLCCVTLNALIIPIHIFRLRLKSQEND